MRKKISALAVILALALSCFSFLGAGAAEEPTVYYSVDKSKWFELPASYFTSDAEITFRSGQRTASVYSENGVAGLNLTEKVQFVYFYAEAPEGTSCDFYATINTSQDLEPWKDLIDGGEWVWNAESVYAAYPVRISGTSASGTGPQSAVAVPLRLGRPDVYVDFNSGSGKKLYKISVNGLWTGAANTPSITDLHSGFRVYIGDAAGYPILMGGASLANDNQTYLFTGSKYRVGNERGNWDGKNMWVGANFSKWLEGSAYVMMPGHGMVKSHATYNDTDDKFFDLTIPRSYSASLGNKSVQGSYGEDIIGEVVVLMTRRADKNSAYYKEEGWECVNSGTTPNAGGSKFSPLEHPRNFNDYTDAVAGDDSSKYYGAAVSWINSGGNREDTPGIDGTLSTGSYSEYAELNYAYRKYFKAGDTISIYSPANIESDDETCGLIIPVIKYYMPESSFDIKDVEAKYISEGDGIPSGGAVAVNVTTLLTNYAHGRTIKAVYALYDENGALESVGAKTREASTTSDEFIFECAKGKAKYLTVLFMDENGEVIAEKKTQINP